MTNADVPDHLGSWMLCPPGPPTRPPALTESEPDTLSGPACPGGVGALLDSMGLPVGRLPSDPPRAGEAAPPAPAPPAPAGKPRSQKKVVPSTSRVMVLPGFVAAIRKYRVRAKVDMHAFADSAGVDIGTLARLESGADRLVGKAVLRRVAAAAGIKDPENYWREVA